MSSPKWITASLKQTWCASSVIIIIIGQGMLLGHNSCLLPAILAPDSDIEVNIHSASWLASSLGPAFLLGTSSACNLMDRFGRRLANLLSILPGIVGCIMTYLAQNYSTLLIGRILCGITTGAVAAVGIIMIGEYTSPQYRGMFLNLKTSAVMIGVTIVHILGNYLHWRTLAIIALIPHIIAFLITCTWPESPTWLATRKRYHECEQEFFWLRGKSEKAKREVRDLLTAQKERSSQSNKKMSFTERIGGFFRKFTDISFLKPLFTTIISSFAMEASGRHYFPTYALQIMGDVIDAKSLPYYYTFCVNMIITVASLLSAILITLMKRRTLLFSSGISSLIVLVCLCIYSFLISRKTLSNDYPWIVTSIFMIYFFLTNLGCTPIPLALQGELFPVAHRESGTAVLSIVISASLMGVLKVIPYLLAAIKVYGTFAFFGVIMATSLLILYYILPETKDKTLQEIENYYTHGRFREDNDEKFITQIQLTSNDNEGSCN